MSSLQIIEQRLAHIIEHINREEYSDESEYAEIVVSRSGIKGLAQEHVIIGKTPVGIAQAWLQSKLNREDDDGKIVEGGLQAYPLLPYSKVIFENIRSGHTDDWTFSITLRAPEQSVDVDRLRSSIDAAVNNHPVFCMRIDEQGLQHYEPGCKSPYFNAEIDNDGGFVYLHIMANRILGDATSFALLYSDICKSYCGQSLQVDRYLQYVKMVDERSATSDYQLHKEWLKQHYDNLGCLAHPVPDVSFDTNIHSMLASQELSLRSEAMQIADQCKRYKVSLNTFMSLAVAIAIMDYNGTDEAALTWAYMGRDGIEGQHIFGSLHRDIPMRILRNAQSTPSQMLAQANRQVQQGITHSECPYTFLPENRKQWKDAVNVLIQPDTSTMMTHSSLPFEFVEDENNKARPAYCMLDVEITENPLMMTLKYSSAHYKETSVARFASLIRRSVEWLQKND